MAFADVYDFELIGAKDKLGIQGKRIQGGDLVPALAQAPHNADGPFPTVTVEDCVAGSDSQQWVLDSPHPGK